MTEPMTTGPSELADVLDKAKANWQRREDEGMHPSTDPLMDQYETVVSLLSRIESGRIITYEMRALAKIEMQYMRGPHDPYGFDLHGFFCPVCEADVIGRFDEPERPASEIEHLDDCSIARARRICGDQENSNE